MIGPILHSATRPKLSLAPSLSLLAAERPTPRAMIKGTVIGPVVMLMYGKEASNRKQEIDRQHYTIPNQRPKDKHFEKI